MSNPLESFMLTSVVGDFSYQSPSLTAAGKAHPYVTGRKTWKTMNSKTQKQNLKEAVWPPHIEAALFDALEKYRPASAGDPRRLRRFPKRNRFISDYIQKVTGKIRTPKQVGSRLQQLRDTCREEKVLALLSRRDWSSDDMNTGTLDAINPPGISEASFDYAPSLSSSTNTTPASSPTSPSFPECIYQNLELCTALGGPVKSDSLSVHTSVSSLTVHIEFIPSTSTNFFSPLIDLSHTIPTRLNTFDVPTHSTYIAPRLPSQLRVETAAPLCNYVPCITFSSATLLSSSYRSYFYVFVNGTRIHSETTELSLISVPDLKSQENLSFTYGTSLIPGVWAKLCKQTDISQCTITQDIMRFPGSTNEGQSIQNTLLFTVTYGFVCPMGLQLWHDNASDIMLPMTGAPGLGPGVPIRAPRSLPLADASNTLFNAFQPHQEVYESYDHSLSTSHLNLHDIGDIPFDTRWSDIDPWYHQLEQPWENNASYSNFPLWA